MQIRESVAMRVVDKDRVGIWNVESTFDDRCGQQHIEATLYEVDHDALQFGLSHLTMTNAKRRLRDDELQLLGDCFDIVHTIVHKIDLTAAT